MKCIYSTLRPPIDHKSSYSDWITNCDQKLSLSTKGLVAFTSSFCLNQQRPQAISYHVYVADLNQPYRPYLVQESEHDISILEWDSSGSKLLVCDTNGCATIYTSKDFLISDWKPAFKQIFAAETFITACWYHTGIVSTINVANQNLKTSSNHLEYSDKIQQTKFSASLRLFGGRAAEGCILISQTGLVCCLTLMADGTLDVTTKSLGPMRTKLHVADISYSRDGSFIVGTSSGTINSTILFYKITLSIKNLTLDDVDMECDNKRVQITCKQYHSFHLNVMSQILSEMENSSVAFERVNQIKFVSKDSPDDVLVEISGQNLSLIELWELETHRRTSVHQFISDLKQGQCRETNSVKIKTEDGLSKQAVTIQNSTKQAGDDGPTSYHTKQWSFKGNYINTEKELVTIQVPKFKMFGSNRQLNIILLAYKDSTICCLRKEDLQPVDDPLDLSCGLSSARHPMTNRQLTSGESDSKSPYKQFNQSNGRGSHTRVNGGGSTGNSIGANSRMVQNGRCSMSKPRENMLTNIQLSANQTLFVGIDSMSQLHAVRLPPLITCQDVKDEETYLQLLLEYCLITGNDWWDILVCTKRESIETICDKFHDAYERQPKNVQRKFFNRHLMIRAALYRSLNDPGSLCKSSDCHTMIMLNSIASTLKSMLRSQDQDSPSDQLANFLKLQGAQASFFNCNNVISKLNEKEFYVESNLVQCLQPLIQWVVDFASFLVASLPQRVKTKANLLGAGLGRNKEALEILRELLVIIKIWGKLNTASMPVIYQLNDQIDAIGSLYRMISIYHTTCNSEPEQFIMECAQFANNVTVAKFEYFLEATGVASLALHSNRSNTTRLVLEYFQELVTPVMAKLDQVEGSVDMNGSSKMDVVRNISLGAHPLTNLRHCTRCRAVSLLRPSFNTTRAWEQRWMNTCVCGGHWAQSNRIDGKVNSLSLLHQANTVGSLNQLASQLVR